MISGNRTVKTILLLVLLSTVWLGGCAVKRAKPLSQPRQQALQHNRLGIEAAARGDRGKALSEFSEALRLQSSIDNSEGMIVALVNSARIQRLQGDLQSARQSVERALSLSSGSSIFGSELFYEKAKVLSAAGDLTAALEWGVRAEAAEQGEARGRRQNLVALLLLRQGFPDQAKERLEQALQLNRKARMSAEEANSQRLLGEIHLVQGSYDKSGAGYQEALILDKALGLGARIAADLSGLGAVAARKGDIPGAIGWYQRSLEVSRNGGDKESAAATTAELAHLYQLNGQKAEEAEKD